MLCTSCCVPCGGVWCRMDWCTQSMMTGLMIKTPEDPLAYLAECIVRCSNAPRVRACLGWFAVRAVVRALFCVWSLWL